MPNYLRNFAKAIKGIWAFLFSLILITCTDPVDPKFNYQEGLIYIDAFASSALRSSYVVVSESNDVFGSYRPVFQSGARVVFINSETSQEVVLTEEDERYVPPLDFGVSPGEKWRLEVTMDNGTTYVSEEVEVEPTVAVGELQVTYNPESYFSENYDRFVPAHDLSLTFQDPAGEDNYYLWQFKSFEQLTICQVCTNYSVFRDGGCRPQGGPESGVKEYYTYNCEEACWQIRYNNSISIFGDEFTDGKMVSDLSVATVPLYQKRDILVNLEQYNLSRDAYKYYKTVKDLVDNNSGFNAPLPAALIGNMYNPNNAEEFVLGRFTAAEVSEVSVFIPRGAIAEKQLEDVLFAQAEGFEAPTPNVLDAPCSESFYRTNIKPTSWPD